MHVLRQRLLMMIVLAVASVAMLVPSTAAAADGDNCTGANIFNADDGDNSYVYSETALNDARAAGFTDSVTFTCDGSLAAQVQPGTGQGQASYPSDGDVTVTAPTASPTAITVAWTPRPEDLATGQGFSNDYKIELSSGNVVVQTVTVTFVVTPQYDIIGGVAAPASIAVLPAGNTTNQAIAGSFRNGGPNTTFGKTLAFILGSNVTATNLPTGCTPSNPEFEEPGTNNVYCQIDSIDAGATKTFSINLALQPGVKGLVLPSSTKVSVTDCVRSCGAPGETDLSNNTATATIALVAATCATDQTGTPPNCVTPVTKNVPTVGDDTLLGTIGDDLIRAGAGDDRVFGGAGNDTLYGETGNDKLYGGTGNDKVSGGEGDDLVDGGAGNDKLTGNSGNDKMGGGAGNDAVDGGSGNDRILGGAGNDKLAGGSGNDTIICGTGNDVVSGGAGNDKIGCKDGKGGDVINGGGGNDACYGDANDIFILCEKVTKV